MSKAFTEDLMYSYRNELPMTIIRPSIIVAAENEPEPGFIQGLQVKFKLNQFLSFVFKNKSILGNDWYDSWTDIRGNKNFVD